MKAFVKRDRWTDIGHFIISRPGPIGWREIKIEKQSCYTSMCDTIGIKYHVCYIITKQCHFQTPPSVDHFIERILNINTTTPSNIKVWFRF